MTELEDATLIADCLRGDEAAFAQMVERYQRPIFTIALRMVHDYEDARDIAQGVFVKAYENLGSYDPRFRLFSWLYRMALNESINFLKKKRSHLEAARCMFSVRSTPVETSQEEEDRAVVLERALMALPLEQRTVVIMKHLTGRSYRDLSEILKIPEKLVKSRLFEARRRLKQILICQRTSVL
jgi:RNA polymerase sigma-70 factor (ECF subfamily)